MIEINHDVVDKRLKKLMQSSKENKGTIYQFLNEFGDKLYSLEFPDKDKDTLAEIFLNAINASVHISVHETLNMVADIQNQPTYNPEDVQRLNKEYLSRDVEQ